MRTMWCTNCGSKLIEGARFCDKCGAMQNHPPLVRVNDVQNHPGVHVTNAGSATRPLVQAKIVLPNQKQLDIKIDGTTTIGRKDVSNDCDIDVTEVDPHLYSSRRHAEIIARFGEYYIKDVGSRNGTYINNRKIGINEEVKLNHQDRIILGNVELVFLCE